MQYGTHTQSLVYMGRLDMMQTPLILNLYHDYLLFHQMIAVDGLMQSEGYICYPAGCYLHASEILRAEWENSSASWKEKRIKSLREIGEYLLRYEPVQLLNCETISSESEVNP